MKLNLGQEMKFYLGNLGLNNPCLGKSKYTYMFYKILKNIFAGKVLPSRKRTRKQQKILQHVSKSNTHIRAKNLCYIKHDDNAGINFREIFDPA